MNVSSQILQKRMISANEKADVKQQEMKELVAVSFNFIKEVPSKLEILCCKTCMYFTFNFGWSSIQFDIVH